MSNRGVLLQETRDKTNTKMPIPFAKKQGITETSAIPWLNSDKELITYQLLADGFRGAYGQIPSDF